MTPPHFIGIAGRSGAGKTTLARELREALGPQDTSIVPIDSYYQDLTDVSLAARKHWNFDHPGALDWKLLVSHLETLRLGRTIEMPVYDFRTHSRTSQRSHVHPGTFVIVEGVLALYQKTVRTLLDTRIFVMLDQRICLARRTERDVHERGRTPPAIAAQHSSQVEPMFSTFARSTQHFADIVVHGSQPAFALAARLSRETKERCPDVASSRTCSE